MAMPSNPEWNSDPGRSVDDGTPRWVSGSLQLREDGDAGEDDSPDDGDASPRDEPADREERRGARRTDRWVWTFGLAVLLVAAGLATTEPILLVAGAVPLVVAAAAGLTRLPPVSVSVTRSIDVDPTAPGEPVEVDVTVRNDGDAELADVRIVDLLPREIPVQSGSPRAAFSLPPGESRTVSYTVGARRGVHEFGGIRLRVRNALGTALAEDTVEAAGDDALECDLPVRDVPLADDASRFAGAVTSDEPGEGLEFFSVREYRRGDDISDVDWRRYARTGELTTIRYRQERSATVVLGVDARDEAYVAASPEMPSAAELSAFAAERAFEALAASHHEVGLAALLPGSTSFVEPGTGTDAVAEARDVLETVADRNPIGRVTSPERALGEASTTLTDLERRVPGRAQVVLFSPATDRFTERLARGLLAHGYPVTLVVPLVATEPEPAQQVVRAEQAERLVDLRGAGARVVEWDREEALPLVLERAMSWGDRA